WERNLTNKNLAMIDLTEKQREEKKKTVKEELQKILVADTQTQADALLGAFRTKWEQVTPLLVQYLNKNYFDSESDRRRWMYCYRQ
ncbi:hypothetical protein BGZ46_006545, partial [Entomortierella lignicola]